MSLSLKKSETISPFVTMDDGSLHSTCLHRIWVMCGCVTILVSLVKSVTAGLHSNTYLPSVLAAFLGYVIADLVSGIYHWAIDNYSPFVTMDDQDDGSLHSTCLHRIWVMCGCVTILVSLVKSVTAGLHSNTYLPSVLAAFLGYVIADLVSGIYHWAIDNYGNATTPFFGEQIEAFQSHHKAPSTITKRQFANNLCALGRATTVMLGPINLASDDTMVHAFTSVCFGCLMFSQQFHAWAHGAKSRLPPLVVMLQDIGVLASRREHAAHHQPPYDNNYCIVSGIWNKFVDKLRVFEAIEMVLFVTFGYDHDHGRMTSTPSD